LFNTITFSFLLDTNHGDAIEHDVDRRTGGFAAARSSIKW